MADCLNMIHFHIGSQVGDIRQHQGAVNELAHIYCELKKLGAGLDTIDVGGGMGIDYDGSQSDSARRASTTAWPSTPRTSSTASRASAMPRLPAPAHLLRIRPRDGRALLAADHRCAGQDALPQRPRPAGREGADAQENERPQPVLELIDAYESLTQPRVNIVEVYHDAVQARDEAMSLFNLGYISLPMRAATERLFWAVGRKVLAPPAARASCPTTSSTCRRSLSDIYYVNFSLFQSLPDHWAIDQLFPIVPIHRLDEEPTRRAILADITCDSDGQVDKFIDKRKACKTVLELHELKHAKHDPAAPNGAVPASTSRTTSACSSSARTRKCSATCTTSTAIPTSSTSRSTTRRAWATGTSTRWSKATPSRKCSRTCSTTART
jgi:arginine decarboxylase